MRRLLRSRRGHRSRTVMRRVPSRGETSSHSNSCTPTWFSWVADKKLRARGPTGHLGSTPTRAPFTNLILFCMHEHFRLANGVNEVEASSMFNNAT
jgi:hypothetical protein